MKNSAGYLLGEVSYTFTYMVEIKLSDVVMYLQDNKKEKFTEDDICDAIWFLAEKATPNLSDTKGVKAVSTPSKPLFDPKKIDDLSIKIYQELINRLQLH